jgi:toxin ParE1/3/4
MPPYIIRRPVLHDLRDISLYTRRTWDDSQEEMYMRGLFLFFDKIARRETPLPPRDISGIYPGCWVSQVSHHLIVFRWLPDGRPEIIRVLHERMNVSARVIEAFPPKRG